MLRESLLAEQFLGEKLRLRLNHTREYCGHFGLCGLDGLIVPKPSHHLEPAGVVRKPRLVASYLAVHTEGKRDVGRLSRYDAVEFRGSDANDGENRAIEAEGPADYAEIHAETAFPKSIADYRDRARISFNVIVERTAGNRRNTQHGIVISGDLLGVHDLWLGS